MAAKKRKAAVKLSAEGEPIQQPQHGPETVCYANDGFGYKPFIACLCGWKTPVGSCIDWAEAGGDFDEHLAAVES